MSTFIVPDHFLLIVRESRGVKSADRSFRGGVEFCYVCIDDDTVFFFALEAQDNAGLLVDAHGEGIDSVLCREIIGRDAGYNDA